MKCHFDTLLYNNMASVQYASVGGDGHDLPWDELAAALQRGFRGVLKSAAAGDLHADYGDALYVVVAYYVRELFGIINGIELRAADERYMAFDEFSWNEA
jgi:hypothetical protein